VSLSASRWVPALGWGVVVHRSKNVVLQRTRTLILAAAAVAVVLAATLAGLAGSPFATSVGPQPRWPPPTNG